MSTPDRDTRLSYRGAARIREDHDKPVQTTDQRLLRSPDSARDPWRVLRIQSEFVEGFDTLSTVSSAVTVFGSARVQPGSPFYELGRELGAALDIIDAQQLDINELGEEVDSLNSQIADLEVDPDTAYSERDAMQNEAIDLGDDVRRLEEELAEAQS